LVEVEVEFFYCKNIQLLTERGHHCTYLYILQ